VRKRPTRKSPSRQAPKLAPQLARLIAQLDTLEETSADDATLRLSATATLHVSNLKKILFPDVGVTKADVMRYYVRVSPALLPILKDRPLSLKRYPNGVGGEFFFQQKAPPNPPPAVRVETVVNDVGEQQERLVGDSIATLLYCTQLGAFEMNPWNVKVSSFDTADFSVIDLDPGPKAPFSRVVEVAGWVKEALDARGLYGAVKTSGATGIHIFVPLPPRSTEQTATLVAELIANTVVNAHPKETTIERSIKERGGTKVYVDYGQNARGKTVACAYSIRAHKGAPVSTPLNWDELTESLHPLDFTIQTLPERLAKIGDIWGPAMRRRNSVRSVTKT